MRELRHVLRMWRVQAAIAPCAMRRSTRWPASTAAPTLLASSSSLAKMGRRKHSVFPDPVPVVITGFQGAVGSLVKAIFKASA